MFIPDIRKKRGGYGRAISQKVGLETHFALYSGGTWSITGYCKNCMPRIRGLPSPMFIPYIMQ
jgi:hypothetical protein